MNTWADAEAMELPPLTFGQKVVGAMRLAAFLGLTVVSLAVFVPGRYLRAWLGHRVTFHFGLARLWCRWVLWLLGLTLHVEGRPVTGGALVANHASWVDVPVLRAVTLIYFVAKAEVRGWPGIGFITRVTGTIFIERRRSQAKAQERMLRQRIAADQLLCFFPEGTSTDGLRVLPFKSSLFSAFFVDDHAADLWVQPVSIRYRVAEGAGLPEGFYAWWGDMDFGWHIWQVMARSHGGRAEVIFHPAVKPAGFPGRKELADHCGRVVAGGHARLG